MGFTPAERPRLAVAVDGMLAAIHEPARVTVVELPNLAPFAEIGIDREASACDVAWVGMPPRLLVLSRYEAYSRVHLLDPYGPRTIAEIRLESPMRLVGTIGGHALAVGEQGAAVLSASETHVTPYQFPARAVPVAAGAAGSQFVVALSGAIEEWDPASRMPKRRLRLPRPAAITALGGSDRVVWLTTKQDPARVDVIPIVNRGQPKAHDLPEPIAQVAAHPRTDLLACVGGDSGRLYVIDLDGRGGMRIVGPEGIARVEAAALVVGRTTGVLAAQAGHPLALVSLDGREPVETPAPRAAQQPRPGDPKPSKPAMPRDRTSPWRDELVAWYRAFLDGSTARDAPRPPLIDQLVQRFELSAELQAALALLYAAHLAGEGAAPVDVARVLDGNWAEALGRGQLAERGLTVHRDSRVWLAPTIQRALDELPPITGTLIGEPGTIALLGPCTVVAAAGAALAPLAERFLGQVGGAILAGHDHAPTPDIVLEARAHGAVPMVRTPVTAPAIIVAATDRVADELGLPRID